MNPLPQEPSGGGPADADASRRFAHAMFPLWNHLHAILAQNAPEEWSGYRCAFGVRWDTAAKRFLVSIDFRDGRSNRVKHLSPAKVVGLVGSLHEAYRTFAAQLEWHQARLTKVWDDQKKQWTHQTEWAYGREAFDPGPDPTCLN